jgi:cytochrome c-type biogenesis protein
MAVIRVAGGIICIVFGLHLVGIAPIGLFYRQVRMDIGGGRLGAIGTFLMGMTFAAGWTPCVGPILGTISALAMNEGMVGRAMFLLLVYSAGMALPFLLAAAAMGTFLKLTRKLKRYLHYIEIGSGFLLIVLGILMLTNRFTVLSQLAAAFYSAPR